MSSVTRPLFTIRCSCPTAGPRAPIFRVAVHTRFGAVSRAFSLCRISTRLYTGHDYQPGGRAPAWESTVAQQKAENAHIRGQDEASFMKLRTARDVTLPMPKLILSALQINIAGGRLPEPESNGRRYLKIPLDALENSAWG